MCGIIACCSQEAAARVVVEGLKRMEYRGYDSAGIALIADGQLVVKKDIGNIHDIEARHKLSSLAGNIAIGRTRWATHGGVTSLNVHPHCDCSGRIAVVHNGIIENYQELRRQLIERGHRFVSETDTEVIPHLIEEKIKNGTLNLIQGVLAITSKLEGSYAFLVISGTDPSNIIGARKGSPLVIGVASHLTFAASDALAFPDSIDQLIPLGDEEVAVLTENGVDFFDNVGNRLQKETRKFTMRWGNPEYISGDK